METHSEKDKTTEADSEEATAVDDSAEKTAYDAAFEDEDLVAEPQKPARLPLLASLTAITLSVLSLAGVAWVMNSTPDEPGIQPASADRLAELADATAGNEAILERLQAEIATLRSALEPLPTSLATVEQRVVQLGAEDGAIAADVDALEQSLQRRLELIDSIPARVASMERSVSTLRGISTGARDAWLLAQAEYFLQIANAELELSRNPTIAEKALSMADERLVAVGDPGLTDVRRELSTEQRALEALNLPDIAGTTVTLASLSRVVDSLPIRRQLLTKRPEDSEPVEAGTESDLSGTDRAMATLSDAFSGFISVRRTDEAAQPLIAPESVYFLRANLALQLQAARLALLTGEQPLFEQSLDDAMAWLREYYDTDSAPVRSALTTMSEIRGNPIVDELPDISESLRLLRQYIAFQDAGRSEQTGTGAERPQ